MLIKKNIQHLKQRKSEPKIEQNSHISDLLDSKDSNVSFDLIGLSMGELVQKIKDQQVQIDKLIKIIDSYKRKIKEFQQYQSIIKDFQLQQKKEERLNQLSNIFKQKSNFTSCINYSQTKKQQDKSIKLGLFPNFSITILCEKQKLFSADQNEKIVKQNCLSLFQSSQQQKIRSKKNFFLSDKLNENSRIDTLKENRNLLNQSSSFAFARQFIKSRQFGISNVSKMHHQDSKKKAISVQRVPSLNNVRRIEKCIKLLKI